MEDIFFILMIEVLISSSNLPVSEEENALNRAFRRIVNTSENYSGIILNKNKNKILIKFKSYKNAILSANDVFNRIENLPPPGGKPFKIRAVLDYIQSGFSARIEDVMDSSLLQIIKNAKKGDILITEAVYQNIDESFCDLKKVSSQEDSVYRIVRTFGDNLIMSKILEVRYKDQILFLNEKRPVLLIGREKGNDIVVENSFASRQHARIEWKNEIFVITDHSTNGCYVLCEPDDLETVINKDTTELIKKGKIGCGFSIKNESNEPIFFEIVENK